MEYIAAYSLLVFTYKLFCLGVTELLRLLQML